ncbi:hypothetical protein [Lacticigenium naphthae]|uniref:YqgU-like beta propeller domain-containing protein n=1 Tax=Lacticigenium naphthae TaxID=515351 RepID=UPI0003F6FA07|nr:hypothetical protein [Lacticigenium naphthae]
MGWNQLKQNKGSFIILFFSVLYLTGCTNEPEEAPPTDELITVETLDIPEENFRKIVGWLTDEEVLVHTGDEKGDVLFSYHIQSGEMKKIIEKPSYFLTTNILKDQKLIFLQTVEENSSLINIVDFEGNTISENTLPTNGYLTTDWNKDNDKLLFLSYYDYNDTEEEVVTNIWNSETNELTEIVTPSLNPKWYSSNLYLYVDNQGDSSLEAGHLYLGDLRNEGGDLLINYEVSDFFLHEDTFIAFTSSDISEDDMLLTYEFPFMVEGDFLTIPKVTMNDRLIFPYIDQSNRGGKILAVISKETVQLESESGDFELVELDFENGTIESIIDVPDYAPISLSENEKFVLYGWRNEFFVDVENKTMVPFIQQDYKKR